MKKFFLINSFLLGFAISALAQNKIDQSRIENFKEFCNYLRQTDTLSFDTAVIRKNYVDVRITNPKESSNTNQKREMFFFKICKDLKKNISDLDLSQYDASLIGNYHFSDIKKYNSIVGEKDRIYIYYLKERPEVPLGVLYFASNSPKVISWLLLNESGTLFFFTLD